jgi:hypothetical protein
MTAVAHAPSEQQDRRGRLHVSDRFDEMMARLDSIEETVRANGAQHDADGRGPQYGRGTQIGSRL